MKAIQVEKLSKSTLVGHNNARAESYTALRDVLACNAKNRTRKALDRFTGREGQTPETSSFRPGRRNPGPWTVVSPVHNGLTQPRCQGEETEELLALKDITTK